MLNSTKHVYHIYERSKTNKQVYRCIHPECSHYNRVALLLGKLAECYKCHEKFVLTAAQLKNFHPVCLSCSKAKRSATVNVGANLLKALFEIEQEEDVNAGLVYDERKEENAS